jgi:hypothetical protein
MLDIDESIDNEIHHAVSFIQEALEQEPSYVEVESTDEEAESLLLDKDLDELSFHLIREKQPPGVAVAVDGGSATVVKGRSFLIAVYRVGAVYYEHGRRIDQKTFPLKLEVISKADAQQLYNSAYSDLAGKPPSDTPGMEKILDRLRLFSEWKMSQRVLDELGADDILLLDGSLKASIAPPYHFVMEFCEKAENKGVRLVGVTKTSTLYWGDKAPLIPAVMKRGERFHPNSKWFCRLSDEKLHTTGSSYFGRIYVARLKASSNFGFRIDVNRFTDTGEDEIFSNLSWLSADPASLGYPYPLAAAHGVARITSSEVEDIRYKLQSEAFVGGISQSDWDLLFTDFHEILNADMNG